jgi:two-component sensor histidine kinase
VNHGLLICRADDMRLDVSGPDVIMPANATVSLVMVLHELATNAMKYGALSGLTGRVTVRWALDESEMVVIDWVESGGPEVNRPERKGFGSRLLAEAIPRQLGGRVDLDYDRAGLRCRIAVPHVRPIPGTHDD